MGLFFTHKLVTEFFKVKCWDQYFLKLLEKTAFNLIVLQISSCTYPGSQMIQVNYTPGMSQTKAWMSSDFLLLNSDSH